MATFAAEVYETRLEDPLRDFEAKLKDAASAMTAEGAAVEYVRALLLPGDETCFYVFEADSAALVSEAAERAGVPCVRVVEAVERKIEPRETGGRTP